MKNITNIGCLNFNLSNVKILIKYIIIIILLFISTLLIKGQNVIINSLPFTATGVLSDGGSNMNSSYCGTANADYFVSGNDYSYSYMSPCDQTITVIYSNAGNMSWPIISFIIKENGICLDGYGNTMCNACGKTFTINAKAGATYLFISDYNNISYNFDINVSGTGCSSGCTAPDVQTNNFTFIPGGTNEIINWTNGNGAGRVVYINNTNNFTTPANGSNPTANTSWQGTGEQCIYNGNGNSVNVSNLMIGLTYYVRAYEYCNPERNYNTLSATNNPSNFTTQLGGCSAPIMQATANSCTGITSNSTTVNWTRGNGNNVIVVARLSSTAAAVPTSGISYAANPVFGTGNITGNGNFVVYNGNGNTVTVTGLTAETDYTFTIYEYYNMDLCYNTAGSSSNVTTLGNTCNYCSHQYSIACFYTYIDNISVSDLNQTGTGCNNSYSDFTNITVNFIQGNNYPFTITSNLLGADNFGWWIDFNDDCDFADAGEFLGNFTSTTGTINIPADAILGKHRMRVRGGYSSAFGANSECSNQTYGESHDYIANINAACTAPTIQASNISFSSTGNTNTTVNWTRGNGTGGVIVVGRLALTAAVEPVVGTNYTGSSNFGSGNSTGTGNFVVYNGTGSSVTVTGLTEGTAYVFTVYEYNITGNCYKLPGNTSTVTTSGTTPSTCQNSLITNVPFTANYVSNCTGVNRQTACGSTSAQTYIYKFIAPASACYSVNLTGLDEWYNNTLLDISTDCDGKGVCIAKIEGKGALSLGFDAISGTSYFISIAGGGMNNCSTFNINLSTCPAGSSCSSAAIINTIPFNATNVSNCTNNIRKTACGNGTSQQAYIYKFIAPSSGCYNISLSNLDYIYNDTYLDITTECGGIGNCVLNTQGKTSISSIFTATAGTNYFISISGGGMNNCSNFNINLSLCPPGSTCSDAVIINSLPYTKTGVSNCIGDNIGTTSCGNHPAQDIIFKYTATKNECVGFTVSGLNWGSNSLLGVYNGCPTSGGTCLSIIAGQSLGSNLSSGYFEIVGGNTYYFVISGGDLTGSCDDSFEVSLLNCPPGRSCNDPVMINSLPYSATNVTNCIGDNVSATECGTNVTYGQDIIYKYTSQVSQCIGFNLTNFGTVNQYDGSWLGAVSLYEGCPGQGGSCVKSGSSSLGTYLTGGKTYYFVASLGADIMINCDMDYNINVQVPPTGGSCCSPQNITIPVKLTNQTTCGKSNFFNSSSLKIVNNYPSPYYIDGEDMIYKFTAPSTDCYVFDLEGLGTKAGLPGMYLFDECPETQTKVLNFGGSGDYVNRKTYISQNLISGKTYYLLVSCAATNVNYSGCIDFNLNINKDPLPCNIPGCPSATMAADSCDIAPTLDFCNSYCGNTDASIYNISDIDGNLNQILLPFGMGIHNNSWIKFVADSTEAEWYYLIDNCVGDRGIQFAILESNDCKEYNQFGVVTEAPAGTGYIIAKGLTKGKEYFLMMDGFRTSICDYRIYPHYGLSCETCPKITLNINSKVDVKCKGLKTGSASISASGGVGPYTYVWEPGGYSGNIQSALSAGDYVVSAFDKNNCSGKIEVKITEPLFELSATIINAKPASCGIKNGAATASVSGGTAPYKFRWSEGSTTETANNLGSGSYTVTVTDFNGCTASKSVFISSSGGNMNIDKQPVAVSKCAGLSAGLSIAVSGTPPITYQWYKNDIQISGATNSNYDISKLAEIDEGEYYCLVGSSCGGVPSEKANITVNKAPEVAFITPDIVKCVRDSVMLKVVSKEPVNTYQWYRNGKIINNATNSNYMMIGLTNVYSAVYVCILTNNCGTIKDSVKLGIEEQVMVTKQIENMTVCEGEDIKLTAEAMGTNLLYQWLKDEAPIKDATNSDFTIKKIKTSDANIYSCIVKNNCSSVNLNPFIIYVLSKPIVNIGALIQNKYPGESVSWYLSPTGSQDFAYQWLKDDSPIQGATENEFTINSCQENDAGVYSCVITNNCGSVTTKVSTLIIISNSSYNIDGKVLYINSSNTPLNNTTVYLKNSDGLKLDSAETNKDGYYKFALVKNGSYILECKTKLGWKGVTPIDALMINRYYLSLYKITGDLRIAASDPSMDNKINPIDALFINRRYIGVIKKYNKADWIFEKPAIIVNGKDININVFGICTGDVNTSYPN